jgi:Co/Zn/Cd efflux system component
MASHCCAPSPVSVDRNRASPAYRRVLWAVLAINGAMFLIEVGAGFAAGSASLQADALDFLGDTANYAISLFVVGMALRYRAAAAMVKSLTMGAFGLWIIGMVIWHILQGTLPSAVAMSAVGATALIANGFIRDTLEAPSGRCQHALCLDLHAQRRARKSRGVACRAWCIRHRHRMA